MVNHISGIFEPLSQGKSQRHSWLQSKTLSSAFVPTSSWFSQRLGRKISCVEYCGRVICLSGILPQPGSGVGRASRCHPGLRKGCVELKCGGKRFALKGRNEGGADNTSSHSHTLTQRDQTHFRYRRHVSAVQLSLRSSDPPHHHHHHSSFGNGFLSSSLLRHRSGTS